MARHELVVSGFTMAQQRFFLLSQKESPYFEVYTDLDTESVAYFDGPNSLTGDWVLQLFSSWTRDSLRAALVEHLNRKGHGDSTEAASLVEAVLDSLRLREVK